MKAFLIATNGYGETQSSLLCTSRFDQAGLMHNHSDSEFLNICRLPPAVLWSLYGCCFRLVCMYGTFRVCFYCDWMCLMWLA